MANRRASGEGLLRWRKDRKHWEGRITIGSSDDGKPISKCFSGKTQREVIEKMTRFREQLHGMTLSADSRMKLKDWSERWLNEYMVHVIRPKTISRYRGMLQLHVYPYLGDYRISKITTIQVQRMYNDLKENGRRRDVKKLGKGLSGNTVRGIHMLLHEIMEYAFQEGVLATACHHAYPEPKLMHGLLKAVDTGNHRGCRACGIVL